MMFHFKFLAKLFTLEVIMQKGDLGITKCATYFFFCKDDLLETRFLTIDATLKARKVFPFFKG